MQHRNLFTELRQAAPLISVGVLTADFLSLGSELKLMEEAGVKLLHIDVMDGCFCPMMTVGPPLIQALKTPLLKDVHLMIEEPWTKIESYLAAGADMITVHSESGRHIHQVLQALGKMTNANDPDRGILRGLALNPGTPMEVIEPLIEELDMVLLLAVNPGFSGQKFIPSTRQKIAKLQQFIRDTGRDVLIGVDGGIKKGNIDEVAALGVDIIVTGSAVFDGKTPLENAQYMIETVKNVAKANN